MSTQHHKQENESMTNIKTSIDVPNPDYNLPVIKTAYTKLNAALGSVCGFRRGALVLITSPDNGYRDELALDLYLGAALVNKPVMIDDTKKPLILDVAFETPTSIYQSGLMSRYRHLIEDTEAKDFSLLEKYGYQYKSMIVPDPKYFKLNELFSIAHKLMATGYELHQICVGDLSQIDQTDLAGQPIPLVEMYRRLRYFFDKLGCTVITTLSLDEIKRIRERSNYSKTAIEYLEHQRNISIDEITLYVDTVITVDFNGESLSIVCDKNRGSKLTEPTQTIPIAAEGYFKVDEAWVSDDT